MRRTRTKMVVQRDSSVCLKASLIIYTILFWLSGFALIFLGFYVLFEPKRSYVLEFVNFSEDDPLLTFAAYTSIVAGIFTLFVGFIGFCGALQKVKCLLVGFMLSLIILFLADVAIGVLAVTYRAKFTDESMSVYLSNMTNNRYSRDKWVLPLLDTIQFYQQCCGGVGPKDYYNSFWYITNVERGTRSFVPRSCCKQSQSGRAWSVIPVDPMCTTYFYYSNAFNTSVNIDGCHEKMKKWFDEQTYIFAGVGFGFAALMMIGIIISLLLCNSITYYVHVDDQY